MISWLKGTVKFCKPTSLILDVNGVGYGLSTPVSVFNRFVEGDAAELYVYTHLKEDQLKLFGFITEGEKDLFQVLISVTGIGPSIALSILSGIAMDELMQAVALDDTSRLVKIPGIGKSKAEKIVFELKRKEKKLQQFKPADGTTTFDQGTAGEALDALTSLGFDSTSALSVIRDIQKEQPDATLEVCIKEALKRLSG